MSEQQCGACPGCAEQCRHEAENPPALGVEWPKLDKPALVGAGRFSAGVSSRLVVECAQRLYEHEVTPEKEAQRIAKANGIQPPALGGDTLPQRDESLGTSEHDDYANGHRHGWNACHEAFIPHVARLQAEINRLNAEIDGRDEPAGADVRGRLIAAYGKGRWLKEHDDLAVEVERLRKAIGLAGHWCKSALKVAQTNDSAEAARSLLDVACLLRHQATDIDAALAEGKEHE